MEEETLSIASKAISQISKKTSTKVTKKKEPEELITLDKNKDNYTENKFKLEQKKKDQQKKKNNKNTNKEKFKKQQEDKAKAKFEAEQKKKKQKQKDYEKQQQEKKQLKLKAKERVQINFDMYDENISKLLQSLYKKSDVTKLKALVQLKDEIQNQHNSFYYIFIQAWIVIYTLFTMNEFDRKILEELNSINFLVIRNGQDPFENNIESIFFYLILSMNDYNQEVSQVAQKSFNYLYKTKDSKIKIFQENMDNYLENVKRAIIRKTSSMLKENPSLNEAQAEEIQERIICSCISSFWMFFDNLQDKEQQREFLSNIETIYFQKSERQDKNIISDMLDNSQRLRIKATGIQSIQNLFKNYSIQNLIEQYEGTIRKWVIKIFDQVDSKDLIIQKSLWNQNNSILIFILKNFPKDFLNEIINQKQIELKVFECNRRCAAGIGNQFYSQLVIFLSYLPQSQILDYDEESLRKTFQFLRDFLKYMIAGLSNEQIKLFNNNLIVSYFECAYYIIVKKISVILKKPQEEQIIQICIQYLNEFTLQFIQIFIENHNPNNRQDILKSIPKQFADFLTKINKNSIDESYLSQIKTHLLNIFKLAKNQNDMFSNYLLILSQISKTLQSESSLFNIFQDIVYYVQQDLLEDIYNLVTEQGIKVFIDNKLNKQFQQTSQYYELFCKQIIQGQKGSYQLIKIQNEEQSIIQKIQEMYSKILSVINRQCKVSDIENCSQKLSQILQHWNSFVNNQLEVDKIYSLVKKRVEDIKDQSFENYLILAFANHICDINMSQTLYQDFAKIRIQQDQLEYIEDNLIVKQTKEDSLIVQNLQFELLKAIVSLSQTSLDLKPYIVTIINLIQRLNQQLKEQFVEQISLKLKISIDIFLDKEQSIQIKNQNQQLADDYFYIILKSNISDVQVIKNLFGKIAEITYQHHVLKQKNNSTFLLKLIQNNENENVNKTLTYVQLDNFVNFVNCQMIEIFVNKNEESFDIFTKYIKDIFVHLNYDYESQKKIILSILQQQYFARALYYSQNWELLHILFNQLQSKNKLKEFFEDIYSQGSLQWLFSLLISYSGIQAIVNKIKLRKYFLQLNNEYIKELLHSDITNQIQDQNSNLSQFINYLLEVSENKSLVFANGLKRFLKQQIKDNLTQDNIQTLFQRIIQPLINRFFNSSQTNLQKQIRIGILLKYFLPLFEAQEFSQTFNQIIQPFIMASIKNNQEIDLESTQKLKLLTAIDLSMVYFEKNESLKTILDNSQEEVQDKQLIEVLFKNINYESEISPNYQIQVIFDFVNVMIQKNKIEIFQEQLEQIEQIFKQGWDYNLQQRQFSSGAMIYLLQFLRKIMFLMNKFSENFQTYCIQTVLETCDAKCKQLLEKQNTDEMEKIIDENNPQLVIEFAETIQRFTSFITESFTQYENQLYGLLGCQFPSIQKSVFIVLREFYLNFAPSCSYEFKLNEKDNDFQSQLKEEVQIPELQLQNLTKQIDIAILFYEENEEQEDDDDNEDNKDEQIDSKVFSYILTWVLFVTKLNSQRSNSNYDDLKKLLGYYLEQNKYLYQDFLTEIFTQIKQLNLENFTISHEEISEITPEWSDFLSGDSLIKLLVQGLYVFTSKFPFYLRYWIEYESNKILKQAAENTIKKYVSTSLFLNEINIIDLSQYEWQSEEFDIFVTKNTREIQAVYKKEDSKMIINLKIPKAFPIQTIDAECKKGIKVGNQKINRWMLMMKGLLANQNKTIKDCLLMWKENLNKEFEGFEECPICYYVIHSTTGEMPKMACKTCGKKFHSICINKWFNEKNKAECPACKSQFF